MNQYIGIFDKIKDENNKRHKKLLEYLLLTRVTSHFVNLLQSKASTMIVKDNFRENR